MRHALLACVSRSASLIFWMLVAQYSDVPSVARTRNTLISPNPLSHTIVPSPPARPASETAFNPLRLTLICRFDFRRVKKCQPRARTDFRFSIEPYQLSKQTRLGFKPRFACLKQHFGEMVGFWFYRRGLCQTRDNQRGRIVSRPSKAV